MNDETYSLIQTNKERKTLARSASHRVNGSKSKRCMLPSDNLTQSQLKKLSGPVQFYDLNSRHTWDELKTWPEDLRREYIEKLLSLRPSNEQLGEFLLVASSSMCRTLAAVGIHRRRGQQPKQTDEKLDYWLRLLHGPDAAAIPDPDPDPDPEPQPDPLHGETTFSMALVNATIADLVHELLTDPLLQQITGAGHISFTIKLQR